MKTDKTYYAQPRNEIMPFIPSYYTKVLEIGCGEGTFARMLDLPCEKWGVEPESEVASKASALFDHFFTGTFEQVEQHIPNDFFDLIICNDVIEHVPNHDHFLQKIFQKLSPHGYFIGSVPNVRYYKVLNDLLLKKDWNYVEAGVLDSTHLRFFTKKSLKRSLEKTGFTTREIKGINKIHYFRSLRKIPIYLALLSIEILSLGYHRDIRFPQFAFQVIR
jgi:SAM-dependent methyltransferase